MPDISLELQYSGRIAGVDEAGRGPWAGPVVAGAVILNYNDIPDGINDSKKLSAARRDALFESIIATASVGIGIASVEEIDQLNILAATKLAMQRAVAALPHQPDRILVDGNQPPRFACPVDAIVKGDSKSLSIAAASIIAKVTRDRMMAALAQEFPVYGWEKNAGYGTALHQAGIKQHGITPHHRKSFAPIKAAMAAA